MLWTWRDSTQAFGALRMVLPANAQWLLDPSAGMMIRIFPREFFAAMANQVINEIYNCNMLLILPVLAVCGFVVLVQDSDKREEEEERNKA